MTTEYPLARPETMRPLRTTDLDGTVAGNQAIGWHHRRPLFDFDGTGTTRLCSSPT